MVKQYSYKVDSNLILNLIKDLDSPVVLDSQSDDRSLSRYSIISFDPIHKINYNNYLLVDGLEVDDNPLTVIDKLTNELDDYNSELIFNGGFIGVIRYHYLEDIYNINLENRNSDVSKIEGGIYNRGIIIDHQNNTTTIFNNSGDLNQLVNIIEACNKQIETENINASSTCNMLQTKSDYVDAINKTKAYIKSGDVYEINYTTGYCGDTNLTGIELFKNLKAINPTPFAAYLQFADSELISSSPELFLKMNNYNIATQPMKGTNPRGATESEDVVYLEQLKNSDKDKIELTMIIDLMRNDISKICEPDSVKVENPFMIKAYPKVYQQVADVVGELKAGINFKNVIESLFPSGSITGAPKLRSIEVIDELENRARNSYTGAIGYYSRNKNSTFNVAIRTVDMKQNQFTLNVGGAIVWDSTAEGEFEECKVKAKGVLSALGIDDE